MKKIGSAFAAVVAVAMIGAQAHGQVRPPGGDKRLDLLLEALRPQSVVARGPAMAVSQTQLDRLLRILPPVSVGHGGGAPALAQSQQATMPSPDPSIYGFCYESCKTARAVGSCGTPAHGVSDMSGDPPDAPCPAVEDTRPLEAIAGPDGVQPAGFTFFGQFIDHAATKIRSVEVERTGGHSDVPGESSAPMKTSASAACASAARPRPFNLDQASIRIIGRRRMTP